MSKGVEKQRKSNGGITGKGFMPGQSGNPGGRPKGKTIPVLLREKLSKNVGNVTKKEAILEKVVSMALGGDKWAIEFIADRTEGKSVERVADVTDTFQDELNNLPKMDQDELLRAINQEISVN